MKTKLSTKLVKQGIMYSDVFDKKIQSLKFNRGIKTNENSMVFNKKKNI